MDVNHLRSLTQIMNPAVITNSMLVNAENDILEKYNEYDETSEIDEIASCEPEIHYDFEVDKVIEDLDITIEDAEQLPDIHTDIMDKINIMKFEKPNDVSSNISLMSSKSKIHTHYTKQSSHLLRDIDSRIEKELECISNSSNDIKRKQQDIEELLMDTVETKICAVEIDDRDIKQAALNDIEELQLSLDDDIELRFIQNINLSSSINEIKLAKRRLIKLVDRQKYSSFAEEGLLGMANALEVLLDGSIEIPFIGWRPDYKGYHNTLHTKLQKIRGDTSQIVGEVIERNNVGPKTRILLELLPSFLLYPMQVRKHKSIPSIYNDPRLNMDSRTDINKLNMMINTQK